MIGPIGLDPEALESCVQCGLCLPHCPTWRTTGEEVRSPRGRIDAIRGVEHQDAPIDGGFVEAIESCVGCMACETACPSAVRYSELLEGTRIHLAEHHRTVPFWQRVGLAALGHPRVLRAGTVTAGIAQRLGRPATPVIPALSNLPELPLRQARLVSTGDDVVLLTGCVMDMTLREVHAATVRVLARAGFGVQLQSGTHAAGRCCGALAAHRGLRAIAEAQLDALAEGLPPGVPVISNSAGCGAHVLRNAGRAGAPTALAELAGRTEDVCSWLSRHIDRLPEPDPEPADRPVVALATACHMRNVQGPDATGAAVRLLERYCDVRLTQDDDLCCGAGGSHSLLRPEEAAAIRSRKLEALADTGATRVASANPGCMMHLRAAGVQVSHPVQIIDAVLRGEDPSEEQGSGR